MALSTRGQAIADLIAPITGRPLTPSQEIPVDPASFVVPANTNQILFGSPSGPVTAGNVNLLQGTDVTVSSVQRGTGGNIPGFFTGGIMAGPLWRFTAVINAGSRGKTTSVIWQGTNDLSVAKTAALAWANQLAFTLGNNGTPVAVDIVPSAKSPRITFVRVTDALLPRFGMLVPTDPNSFQYSGYGTGAGNNSYADFISTALALRMTGTTGEVVPQTGYANHALLGVPDKIVTAGDQIDLTLNVGPTGATYSQWVSQYLNYIWSPGNALGFLMVPGTELKKSCTTFAFVGGVWQFSCPAHGYTNQDRVRMTGANAPGFNGSYIIQVIDVNTLGITSGPPSGVAVPTRAKVRRYQLASGIRLGVFAQFKPLPGNDVAPFGLKVSKRNPARVFTGVSFRKKTRKLH